MVEQLTQEQKKERENFIIWLSKRIKSDYYIKNLDDLNDEELKSLIAHEIGHLHYNDGGYGLMLLSLPICMRPISVFIDDLDIIGGFFGIFLLITALFLWPTYLYLFFLSYVPLAIRNKIDHWMDWSREYRADAFANQMGYGEGLISFFEKLLPLDERNSHGFMSRYGYSHPPTAERINQIECVQNTE